MHLTEFKAWFQGYTEEMDAPPNKAQWAKIKKRVAEITADYTPTPVFIEKWVHPYRRYWQQPEYVAWRTNNTADCTSPRLTDWSAAGRAEYRSTT